MPAHGTGIRYALHTASGQVFRYLRDNHIGLIHLDPVSDAEFQVFHDTEIMHAGAADRSPLQFYGLKYGNRIDQSGPGRAPFNLQQLRITDLIRPFKGIGISWELCGCTQRLPIGNIIVHKYEPVRRKIIFRNLPCKPLYLLLNRLRCNQMVFHHFESLFLQPVKLFGPGVMKIHFFRAYKTECKKPDIALCRNLVIQLSYRAAAEIPGILVLCIHILNLCIDLCKILIPDHGLSSQDQLPSVGNVYGKIFEYFCIISDHFPDFPIASCDCLDQRFVPIGQYDRQAVQFPGDHRLLFSEKCLQLLHIFRLIQRKHGPVMPLLRKFAEHFIPDINGRTGCKSCSQFLFQSQKFIVQFIVFVIAHNLRVFLLICTARTVEEFYQLLHSILLVCHKYSPACFYIIIYSPLSRAGFSS